MLSQMQLLIHSIQSDVIAIYEELIEMQERNKSDEILPNLSISGLPMVIFGVGSDSADRARSSASWRIFCISASREETFRPPSAGFVAAHRTRMTLIGKCTEGGKTIPPDRNDGEMAISRRRSWPLLKQTIPVIYKPAAPASREEIVNNRTSLREESCPEYYSELFYIDK